ncbi:hypothetical protein OPV22_009897 [Ensete ventricosum]|uniref:Ferric reductase NAD binding domain-containing protein n=1 Tax=Ensete ventricosum TaxID=4639 RepID=A0AAV8PSR6_ENSVE|nr:hypothetical protein OPV22_009897 [Ensete ventricosum]
MGSPHHIVDISESDTSVHDLETPVVHGKLDKSAPEQLHIAGTNIAQPKAESSSFECNPLFQTPNIMVKGKEDGTPFEKRFDKSAMNGRASEGELWTLCDKTGDRKITEYEVKEVIILSASANKLSKVKAHAVTYAALVMKELDPNNLGYFEIIASAIAIATVVHTLAHITCDFPRIITCPKPKFMRTLGPNFNYKQPTYPSLQASALLESLACEAQIKSKKANLVRLETTVIADVEHQDTRFPKLFIDRPYGAPTQDYKKYDILLLIGLGIGATPFISISSNLLDNTQSNIVTSY